MAFDGPTASRTMYGHLQMPQFHDAQPVGPMPLNMPISVPPIHPNQIPFPLIPATEALLINQMKSMVPNPAAAAAVVSDRPIVTMPEDVYKALIAESDTTILEDDMVSVCSQCNFRNYTMDLKWTNAKSKLKNIDQFMTHLCKQVNFNLIPSQSTPSVPGQPPLPQSVMCAPPQPQSQSDVYNLKSNLSVNAQEFRPIQNHKQANLHHEDQLHQQPHNTTSMTAAVVSTNKDMYLSHHHHHHHNNNNNIINNNNNNNNNNSNNNNNNNVVNNDDSTLRGMSTNEPLDMNDSGTLESGIDSGVHDSGVSDSGVTDPAVADSTPDRFATHVDDLCNACESDSLKNEKDGKKKAKKRRAKPRPQKSEDGSMDNLLCDGVNDKNCEYTNPSSSSAATCDLPPYNVAGRNNNSNNVPAAPGQLPIAPRHRSGSHGKGMQQPNRGHMNDNASGAATATGGARQHIPKPQRNPADNRRPNSRNNNYSNRDDTAATAIDKRNGIERDRSITERNERIRGPRNTSGPTSGGGGGGRRNANVNDTMNNCDATSSAHRGPSVNRRSNNGNGSPYPFNNKKYNNGGGGGGGSSSSNSNSSGAGNAGKLSYNNGIREIDGNLFNASEDYSLAHCVAEDLRMGAGIAVQFRKEFNGVGELFDQRKKVGQVAVLRKGDRYIFYLITKQVSHGKPTLADMKRALLELREECVKRDVRKLAMPRIGCGLDKLQWRDVRDLLGEVFSQTEIEIVVYNFKEEEEPFDSLSSSSSSHLKSKSAARPKVVYRPHPLVKIETFTAVVVFGTSTGHMDKVCQNVNSKLSFQKQYQEQCRKTPVGEVIEIKCSPDYYVYVLLIREHETASFSFKNLESCVIQLNAKLKKASFEFVAFDAVEASDDPAITEKIVTLFRNNIYPGIEIYVCNCNNKINATTTSNSSNTAAAAGADRDHSQQPQPPLPNSSNSPKFNTARRS